MSGAAAMILVCACATAALAWLIVHLRRAPRRLVALIFCLVQLALPWLATSENTFVRIFITLTCCGVFLPKLIDLASQPDCWRQRGFWSWVLNLPNFTKLVADNRAGGPQHRYAMRWLVRGVIEVSIGAAILLWWLHGDHRAAGFWTNHAWKVAAGYLLGFDGSFVLFCGVARVLGADVIDLSRHPILATTPADFWRRYNREAGRFFRFRVYQPLVRRRSSAVAALSVFVINGLGHEYLVWILIGRIQGYQTAFFVLQGIATVLTYQVHPHGAIAHVWRIFTIAFMFVTSTLFFASVNQIFGW